jgi:hypothetical protein
MRFDDMETAVRQRFVALAPLLNERQRRLWAAAEAQLLGYGGVTAVARLTGLSRRAIHAGLAELRDSPPQQTQRVRRPGGGRRPLTLCQPGLLDALDRLVQPTCRGDPQSPLRYCCLSSRRLAEELTRQGFRIGRQKVCELLGGRGYSLQANCKTREGKQHPDRDAQFHYIAARCRDFQTQRQPVISVDTKKKELLGDFKNGGRAWRPKGQPEPVRVHDFASKGGGKATPYGVFDVAANEGWVSVGLGPDTSAFAVQAIRRWWQQLGRQRYGQAQRLLITADSGGSNSSRGRLWKWSLQRLADETGLVIAVSHYPPGTSKWNKIEHGLFSFIGMNWRGRPLISAEQMVELIGATTTRAGLKVYAEVEATNYPKGVRLKVRELAHLQLQPADFHSDWNYTISPTG